MGREMGGSRRQAGDDLLTIYGRACNASVSRANGRGAVPVSTSARAAHLISIFVPKREHSSGERGRNWQCKAVCVGLWFRLVCGLVFETCSGVRIMLSKLL